MRLAKYLAHAGVASRRGAEQIVRAGRVTLDDAVVTDPARPVAQDARVAVDGRELAGPEPRVVLALNKPAGVLSTARDDHGRPTVVALVAAQAASARASGLSPGGDTVGGTDGARGARLYPVGRLDADTTGLILLTNDGELANALLHPSRGVERVYRASVGGGPVGDHALLALRRGVDLDDGPTAPARVRRLAPDLIELVIHEGRKRQVRRMCEAVGHPVIALERTRFGPLRLGGLEPGESRRLSAAEVRRLREAAGG